MPLTRKDNRPRMKPKLRVDPDDALTPAEAEKVRRGMQQIKEGRYKVWRGSENELGR